MKNSVTLSELKELGFIIMECSRCKSKLSFKIDSKTKIISEERVCPFCSENISKTILDDIIKINDSLKNCNNNLIIEVEQIENKN